MIPGEGKTAAEIFKLSNRWIAKNVHNKDKVIQSSVENEMIRGDGYEFSFLNVGLGIHSDFSYTLPSMITGDLFGVLVQTFLLKIRPNHSSRLVG